MISKCNAGYYLFELLLVISTVALMGVLVLHYAHVFDRGLVYTEAQKILAQWHHAHQRAQAEGRIIRIDLNRHLCAPSVRFGTPHGVMGPPSRPQQTIHLPVNFKEGIITFTPDGGARAGSLYLTDDRESCCYALTSEVQDRAHLRLYRYDAGRWHVIS